MIIPYYHADSNSQLLYKSEFCYEDEKHDRSIQTPTFIDDFFNYSLNTDSNSILFADEYKLMAFLSSYDIAEHYSHVYDKLLEYFPNSFIRKEFYYDYETESEILFLVVCTQMNADKSFDKLVELRRNCELLDSDLIKDKIHITWESDAV